MSRSAQNSPNETKKLHSEICQNLGSFLSTEDGPEHQLAVRALAHIASPEAIELLISQLRSPDPDLRCDVGDILAKVGGDGSIEPLIENLKEDPCGEAKAIYVKALHNLGASQSVDLLCTLVKGRGEDKDIAWEDDASGWDDWLDVQLAAIRALGKITQEHDQNKAVIAIIEALEDSEGQEIWPEASQALARLEEPGVSALEKLANIVSTLNRKRIAKALASADCTKSAAMIEQFTKENDISVRLAAFESAVARRLDNIIETGLNDSAPEVRVFVLLASEELDNPNLVLALNDNMPEVQIAACDAIIRHGKKRQGLGLTGRAEKLLRKGSPRILAALIRSGAVAEPEQTAALIEDIVNHVATAREVRLACLRALARLKTRNSVELLRSAAADERQDIRLEAIAALGEISRLRGDISVRATLVLADAIAGDLVSIPDDWQETRDNVVQMPARKGQAVEGDEKKTIQIDREGNIIEPSETDKEQEEDSVLEVEKISEPQSTLEAIFAVRPQTTSGQDDVELDETDITYLELTGSRTGRRRINPEDSRPAHIDVRRLAALVGGETGKAELVNSLIIAVDDEDSELSIAAIDALGDLQKTDVNIDAAEEELLRQAIVGDATTRSRTIATLAGISSDEATKAIGAAIEDDTDIVRAAALNVSSKRQIDPDLYALCNNGERQTRQAAARLGAKLPTNEAVPLLIDFAMIESGVHKREAAKLLAGHGQVALAAIENIVSGEDPRKRLIALNVMAGMLEAGVLENI